MVYFEFYKLNPAKLYSVKKSSLCVTTMILQIFFVCLLCTDLQDTKEVIYQLYSMYGRLAARLEL